MRATSDTIMKQILDTEYIDAKLKGLSYDQTYHVVRMTYGNSTSHENDVTLVFHDCFSASFNTWLEDMTGTIPRKPSDVDFFIHEISFEDIEINGVQLYKCTLVIPMMDCKITCVTIEIMS